MIKKYLKLKKELTEAAKDRGAQQLTRLEVLIDVLYALMIYKLFTLMPNPEIDGFGRAQIYEVLTTSYLNYTVIVIGLVLVIMYWVMNNLMFGNLDRTDGRHASFAILQVFSLMLYIYFIRLDAQFEGEVFLMQAQSFFLALAGFLAVGGWHYALKAGLVSDAPTEIEKDRMYIKLIPEAIVSVITFPLAWFGPVIWTLAWLLLIPTEIISKQIQKKMKSTH